MLRHRRALTLDINLSSYGVKRSLGVEDVGQGTGLLQ